MLGGCTFVVLGLGKNTELPQFFVKLRHECLDAGLERTEIVVVHFLTLGCLCTDQGSAAEAQVGTGCIMLFVD